MKRTDRTVSGLPAYRRVACGDGGQCEGAGSKQGEAERSEMRTTGCASR